MGPLWETYSHNQSIFRALAGLRSDSASDVLRSLVGHVARWTLPAIHCPDITSSSALQKRHHHQYHHHYHLKYYVVTAW